MSVNSVRSEQLNSQKYEKSQPTIDTKLINWQNQINQTRGKLDNLAGKNNMSSDEKKEMEHQLKLEIVELNNKIRQQKTGQAKEEINSKPIETGKAETEPVKDKRVVSNLSRNENDKKAVSDLSRNENDKKTVSDLVGNEKDKKVNKTDENDKIVSEAKYEYKAERKTENKDLNKPIDSELIKTLSNIQNEKDALVNSNRVEKRIDAQKSIEKTEMRIDNRRGRDTSRRETRIENIDIDVSKIAKKYFSKND